MKVSTAIGTVAGVGYLRPAPGTWGSLVALPLGWVLHLAGGLPLLVVATVALFAAGWWATAAMTAGQEDQDPGEIVVDEVVGQWIGLLPLSYAAWKMQIDVLVMWPGWIAAFVLFRLFDILKPGPIGKIDRRGGPFGVMADDALAGVFTAVGVLVLAGLYHGVLGR
ncbi:MAG: phosphatidylglycerophosphatase A [Paracoccaceae bacterium]